MRRVLLALAVATSPVALLLVLSCVPCHAIEVPLFTDTDTFIERAKDIVIARCVSSDEGDGVGPDGISTAEVEVITVLKGSKKAGKLRIATIHSVTPGTNYVLASVGGSAYETDFLAIEELSVVPIPPDFDLDTLQGKPLKEQVQRVFARRLCDVQRALDPLENERAILERGLADRDYDLYTSPREVKIGKIHTASAEDHEGNSILYLDLKPAKLEWSVQSDASKTGYFYFSEPLGGPVWEFSRSNQANIADFEGKVLKARFDGRCPGGEAITVKVGEIVLARRADAPSVIYIIKLVRQEQERLFAEYAVVRD